MSKAGIRLFADALQCMQQTRLELLMGDPQDIRLGQLLDIAKDAVKHEFCKITLERPRRKQCQKKQVGSK
jgi:hypothetical protein